MKSPQLPRFKSVQIKIVVFGTVLIAIPFFIALLLLTISMENSEKEQAKKNLENIALAVAGSVRQWELGQSNLIRTLAMAPEIRSMDKRIILPYFKRLNEYYPDYHIFQVVDKNGTSIIRSDGAPASSRSDRAYVQKALNGDAVAYEAVISKSKHKPAMCFSSPIQNNKSDITGVLAFCLLLSKFSKEISDVGFGNNEAIFVVDQDGKAIIHSNVAIADQLQDLSQHGAVKAFADQREMNSSYVDASGASWWFAGRALDRGWKVIVEQKEDEILHSVHSIRIVCLVLGSCLMSLMAVLLGFAATYILRPLSEFTVAMKELSEGDFTKQVNFQSLDQFGVLALAFNQMAQQLGSLFKERQEFERQLLETNSRLEVEVINRSKLLVNAAKMSALGEMAGGIAHEINNPLAIIHLKAEILKERASEGRLDQAKVADTAEHIKRTAERIGRIIKGLRTFSRDGEADPKQLTALQNIFEETLAFCREKFVNNGVIFKVAEVPPELTIDCRSTQISQVLLNLLNNAFDATEGVQERCVSIELKLNSNTLGLAITDNGSGVPEELKDKIFQPFFSTKEVGRGTGLGLSISKSIIEHHGGQLLLDSVPGRTTFLITLPLAAAQQNVS